MQEAVNDETKTTSRAPSKIIPHAFPGISPGKVAELINNSKLMNYPTGTVLSRENSIEDTFYLILEGEVEVTKVINKDQTHLLKTLTAEAFFGEMARQASKAQWYKRKHPGFSRLRVLHSSAKTTVNFSSS